MNRSKRHQMNRNGNNGGIKLPVPVRRWLLFLLLSCPIGVFSQTATKYDLFDPRNPDCPCHQYQKEAEKEFALANKVDPQQKKTIHADKRKANDREKVYKWKRRTHLHAGGRAIKKPARRRLHWRKRENELCFSW